MLELQWLRRHFEQPRLAVHVRLEVVHREWRGALLLALLLIVSLHADVLRCLVVRGEIGVQCREALEGHRVEAEQHLPDEHVEYRVALHAHGVIAAHLLQRHLQE